MAEIDVKIDLLIVFGNTALTHIFCCPMDFADKTYDSFYFRRTDLFKCIAFERRIALRTFQSEWIVRINMDVSENSGTPKSSILIGFSIINHPFWGPPIFGNTHMF